MKVGVDARLLSRPLTGIGRYTLEMCRALSKEPGVSLCLYSPAPFIEEVFDSVQGATFRALSWNNRVLRQVWGEVHLPIWAKADKVDVFWGPANRLPSRLKGGIAKVVTVHDLAWKYAGSTMRPMYRLLERFNQPLAIRAADIVVADSQSTAQGVLDEFDISKNKLVVVPLGASLTDLGASCYEVVNGIGVEKPYFLFVGTLEPRKNLANLLAAYAKLPDAVKKQASLVVVGGKGWGGVDVEGLAFRLGVSEFVHELGFVDDHVLAALYANALFLSMPSLYEGFGLPLVEAMAFGVPVLTSNNSSMPEVAGDAGVLVEATDVDSISAGLNRMVVDSKFRQGLAKNAKIVSQRFTWKKSAMKIVTSFDQAIINRQIVR